MVGSSAGAALTRSVSVQTLLIAAGGWISLGLLVLYQTYAHGGEEEATANQSVTCSSKVGRGPCASREHDLQVGRTPSLTSSLTGSPVKSPGGSPPRDTSPRKDNDKVSHSRRDETAGWATGWAEKADNIQEKPRSSCDSHTGCKEKEQAAAIEERLVAGGPDELGELDAVISMAAARYNAQLGSASPMSPASSGWSTWASLGVGQQRQGLDDGDGDDSDAGSLPSFELCEAPSPPTASSKPGSSAKEAGQWDEALDLHVLLQPAPPFGILEASSDWLCYYGFSAAEVGAPPHAAITESTPSLTPAPTLTLAATPNPNPDSHDMSPDTNAEPDPTTTQPGGRHPPLQRRGGCRE